MSCSNGVESGSEKPMRATKSATEPESARDFFMINALYKNPRYLNDESMPEISVTYAYLLFCLGFGISPVALVLTTACCTFNVTSFEMLVDDLEERSDTKVSVDDAVGGVAGKGILMCNHLLKSWSDSFVEFSSMPTL